MRNRYLIPGAALFVALSLVTACLNAQEGPGAAHLRSDTDPYDSGGPLIPEQAAYDVAFYDLSLTVSPADSSLRGVLAMTARIVAPTKWIAVDLDTLLAIDSIWLTGPDAVAPRLSFERAGGRVFVELPQTEQPGDEFSIGVSYGGRPRVAPRPPWDGGLTWARTERDEPWIATSNQTIGADVWWPNKDHVSDKPDSVALHITVPAPLFVASNGRLRSVEDRADGVRTFHWFVSTPISAYNVALNIAPYRAIETEFRSVAGTRFPVVFYVLPERYDRGLGRFAEFLAHLRWFESTLGPYPFRADKYGIAQTPHLGMEHQTIIAYGADFDDGAMTNGVDWGFDALHHHELSHEWWGNLVTNADWKDMWVHEGIGTYMQALYLEDTQGIGRYHEYLASVLPRILNVAAVAPRETTTARQALDGRDIYFKGAWTLHAVRYVIGGDRLREALRRFVYPSPDLAASTGGRQVRFVSTDDFIATVEAVSGRNLDWLFEVYLRRAELPRLSAEVSEDGAGGRRLTLRWRTPDDLPFPMPVDVRLGERVVRVEMPERTATLEIPPGAEPSLDPEHWILRASDFEPDGAPGGAASPGPAR